MNDIFSTPAFWSALFALASAIAAGFSYSVNRRSLTSKLMDRLYDLDKLILTNPKQYYLFIEQSHRPTLDYFATGYPQNGACPDDYFKIKGIVYFYLNLFDEIFNTYGNSFAVDTQQIWASWQHWIFERLKHPLIKELALKRCALQEEHGVLRKTGPSVFTDRFVDFISENYEKWRGQCDKMNF